MKGQIVKISSDLHFVSYENNIYPCKCRGIFRKEHIVPVVGDYVLFRKDEKIIDEVCPRKNVFNRPKVSNIDQAFLITSLKLPDFSLNLLDKFISLMEINNVKPIICITKSDLLEESELEEIKKLLEYYESIGYMVIYNTELERIKELLKNGDLAPPAVILITQMVQCVLQCLGKKSCDTHALYQASDLWLVSDRPHFIQGA